MKILLFAALSLAAAFLLGFVALAWYSRTKPPAAGLVDGKLRSCASKRNCVCTEERHAGDAAPLAFEGESALAWRRIRAAVAALGGAIREEKDGWLWAEFRTPVFGFVDDLELRPDAVSATIHVRSASRVGRSDWGVNRRRVEALQSSFHGSRG